MTSKTPFTSEEGPDAHETWESDCMMKYGFYTHFVSDDDHDNKSKIHKKWKAAQYG